MKPSGCKQVTAADVISGWNFSGPLADQIRRKNGSPVAIAQSGQDAPPPRCFRDQRRVVGTPQVGRKVGAGKS